MDGLHWDKGAAFCLPQEELSTTCVGVVDTAWTKALRQGRLSFPDRQTSLSLGSRWDGNKNHTQFTGQFVRCSASHLVFIRKV